MNDFRFSLDIGTRKVAAFITSKQGDMLETVQYSIIPHKSRAVRAGQIHDIDSVAQIVTEIKNNLQNNMGFEINKVSTAIAGRNLKTFRSTGTLKFDSPKEINDSDLKSAELSAIQSVLTNLGDEMESYYFAGHTTARWEIDGEFISHPLGHFAGELKVELISTFLPRRVLESLFSVLKKSGLELSYLTLEPIAACESVLPENMRHIPIIMIDIGAGTSDVAMISKGNVQDFAMIPTAGDFITESLCSELLVDFNEAENIKIKAGNTLKAGANSGEIISYTDIFNRQHSSPAEEIAARIRPAIKQLSDEIATEIKKSEFSRSHTNFAVVLVGGGALTPFIDLELSKALNIPIERIGVRMPSMVNKFSSGTVPGADIMGPHCAVVLGVAKLGHEYSSLNILHVTVNDKKVELLNFSDNNSTVLSALLACRTHRNEIYGKPGLAKTFTLNGKMCVIKGEMPVPAVIKIDNNNADLSTPLKEGDKISFTPAINGKDATSRIDGLITAKEEYVFSSDGAEKRVCFPCKVTVNDIESTAGAFINDRDDISVLTDYSLKSALRAADIDPDSLVEENIAVNVLGDIVEKTIKDFMLIVNGNMVTDTSVISAMDLKPGDRVEYQYIKPQSRVCDFISVPAQGSALKIKINGEEFVFPGSMGKILLNGRDVDHETPVNDGDIIRTVSGRDAEAALVDIFKYIAVDPKDTVGKRLKLFVNQQEASFTTPLQQGADVSISFE